MWKKKGWLAKARNLALCVLLFVSMKGFLPQEEVNAAVALVNVNYNQMNFGTPTLVTGTNKQAGSVYRYNNVLTKDGVTVDALVTLTSVTNLTVKDVDQTDSDANIHKRLNPMLTTSNGTGSVDYKIDFLLGGSESTPVSLYNFYATVIDIDGGGGNLKEFVELAGYTKYTTDATGKLTITTANGKTKFLGISNGLAGRSFDNSAAAIASYTAPVSTVYVTMGNEGSLADRLFSVNFGAAGGVFTTPRETSNPASPTITTSINDGGNGKLNAGEDDLTKVPARLSIL